eukprot:4373770-Karenia_brevis.AAC.1
MIDSMSSIEESSPQVIFQDTCDALLSEMQDVMVDASRLVPVSSSSSTAMIVRADDERLLTMESLPLTG